MVRVSWKIVSVGSPSFENMIFKWEVEDNHLKYMATSTVFTASLYIKHVILYDILKIHHFWSKVESHDVTKITM